MTTVAEIIVDEVASGRLYRALDAGLGPTEDELSDVLDTTLMSICPPYNSAMTIATAVPEVGSAIANIRHRIFRYVMGLLELDHLIELLVKAWHAIPAVLRDAAKTVTAKWNDISTFFKDPSWDSFVNVVNVYSLVTDSAAGAMAFAAEYGLNKGPRWIQMASDYTVDGVASALDSIGAGPIASLVRNTGHFVDGQLVLSTGALTSAWSNLKSGDVGSSLRALSTADPTGTTTKLTNAVTSGDVVGTAEAIVTAPIDAVDSLGSALGLW